MTGLGMVLVSSEENTDNEHFLKMCVQKVNECNSRLRLRSQALCPLLVNNHTLYVQGRRLHLVR